MNKIIVSLTSYPARIKKVSKTIMSMLVQTMEPDSIELWLTREEFPDGEKELPDNLLNLKEYGLAIKWCENLKPHKKYFYSMQENAENIVITIDDDVYYSPRVIETLYQSYLKYPDCVSCLIAHRIRFADGKVLPYEEWIKNDKRFYGIPSHSLLATGVGGVLYPPRCLCNETFNVKEIKEKSLKADDLWLKAMEVLSGVKVVLAGKSLPKIETCKELQETGLYATTNREGGNDRALHKIYEYLDKVTGIKDYFYKNIYEALYDEKILERDNNELREKVENGVAIYGAGEGGMLMMKYINLLTEGKVKPVCFVVTNKGNFNGIAGIPVYTVKEFINRKEYNDYEVIVAVSQNKQEEIKNTLASYGIEGAFYIENMFFSRMKAIKTEIDGIRQYLRYEWTEG